MKQLYKSWLSVLILVVLFLVSFTITYENREFSSFCEGEFNCIVELAKETTNPSLCDLAGIPIEDYLQGTSFVPLLENPDLEWKEAVFSQFHRRPKVAHDGGRYMGYSVRTDRFHYIEWYIWDNKNHIPIDSVSAELYDHRVDPYEKLNRIDEIDYNDDIYQLKLHLKKNFEMIGE